MSSQQEQTLQKKLIKLKHLLSKSYLLLNKAKELVEKDTLGDIEPYLSEV